MTRKSSKTFSLTPSIQLSGKRPGPTYLTPLVPVMLGEDNTTLVYAQIETGLQISYVSKYLVRRLRKPPVGLQLVRTATGERKVEIVAFDVVVCDPDGAPWLKIDDVPFAVVDSGSFNEEPGRIVLGYDSFLSRIRLTVDYPRNKLVVVASAKLLVSQVGARRPLLPIRIKEGEALVRSGSFTSGVVLLAAGLEEALEEFSGKRLQDKFWLHKARIGNFGLPEHIMRRLLEVGEVRNRVLHGEPHEREINSSEARKVLSDAKAVISYLRSARISRK